MEADSFYDALDRKVRRYWREYREMAAKELMAQLGAREKVVFLSVPRHLRDAYVNGTVGFGVLRRWHKEDLRVQEKRKKRFAGGRDDED